MMKQLFIYPFFVLIAFSLQSQTWFPSGASWYYNQVRFFPYDNTYQYFEVVGDTIVLDKSCMIVAGICQCSEFEDINYLYQEGDLIYIYDPFAVAFKLLYNFNLEPGDTMGYHSESFGDTYYLLDSITYWVAGTHLLRAQHFSWLEGVYEVGHIVYELAGSDRCLYPLIGVCDPGTGGLRCYEDSSVGLIKFSEIDIPCDSVVSVGVELMDDPICVYPNPARDVISIQSERSIRSIELMNFHALNALQYLPGESTEYAIQLHSLPSGMYLLRMLFMDGHIQMRKIIIVK